MNQKDKFVLIDAIALVVCIILYFKKAIPPLIAGLVIGSLITTLYMMQTNRLVYADGKKWKPKKVK